MDTNQPPAAAPTPAVAVTDEDLAYAVAVVKKQGALPADQAAVNVAAMPADQVNALVQAGRCGQVAKCREILGLE